MENQIEVKLKESGKTCGWHRESILLEAKQLLQTGGIEARREIIRTTPALDRLLADTVRIGNTTSRTVPGAYPAQYSAPSTCGKEAHHARRYVRQGVNA